MGQLVFVGDGLLDKHFGEEFPHEGVEIGVAFAGGEVFPMQQGEGHNYFKQSLLVLNFV